LTDFNLAAKFGNPGQIVMENRWVLLKHENRAIITEKSAPTEKNRNDQ
jgi:hypothetical protein